MKKNYLLLAFIGMVGWLMTACEKDSSVTDPYADWQSRNEVYLDSIVKVARKNPAQWRIYKDYQLELEDSRLNPFTKYDSVYVKVLSSKDEAQLTPLYSDTVRVFYQGYLINGTRFDGNYTGTLNPQVHQPSNFALSGVVTGWTSAFMHMTEGTDAEIYIPYQLAYGTSEHSSIPGYSVLKFRVYLEKIIHPSK